MTLEAKLVTVGQQRLGELKLPMARGPVGVTR
jgi:hypothetical protein